MDMKRAFFLMRVLPYRVGLLLFGFGVGYTVALVSHPDGSPQGFSTAEMIAAAACSVFGFFLWSIAALRWKWHTLQEKSFYDCPLN